MSTRDVLSALLIVVVWGVNFVAIKEGVAEVTPMLLGAMRFAMVLFPAALFVRPPKVPLRLYVAAGILLLLGTGAPGGYWAWHYVQDKRQAADLAEAYAATQYDIARLETEHQALIARRLGFRGQ